MTISTLIRKPYFIFALALVLFFPAYLINLSDQPVIEDEAIRSLVAFEMYKSGDYISPTMGGDPYLRKPPLYNWFIAGSYALFGNYSEMAIRFPMILSLLFFSLSIFWVVRREFGTVLGILNALIYLTLGRIILYESLHGLIDIAFSWLTYMLFAGTYFLFRREKYLWLFLFAYGITVITWMMKGLPAIVFLGFTLLVLFISEKKFRMLFNWRHFAGIFLLLILLGGYYLLYFKQTDVSPKELALTLLGQTTRRTVVRFGIWETIRHIFVFPIDMLYHFLPWTLLSIAFIVKGAFRKAWSQKFIRYGLLLLIFNILPYWTSPEVHPRYILMLVPLFMLAASYAYLQLKDNNSRLARMIYWKKAPTGLMWIAVLILALRIVFDFTVLPTRQENTAEVDMKASAIALAEKTRGTPLYCYFSPDIEPHYYYHRNLISFRYHYFLSAARDEIVRNTSQKIPGAIYFSFPEHIEGESVEILGEVVQHIQYTRPLPLFRFKGCQP